MARFSSQAGRWHLCKQCGAQCPLSQKVCQDCESGKTVAKPLVDEVFDSVPPSARKSGRAPKKNENENPKPPKPRKAAEAQTLDDDGSGSPRESLTLKPNTVLGAYRIIELLGVGGIGQVYLADHIKLGRKVALKKLRREFTQNPVVVRRFFDEARAANQISHENIVEITDFIEDEKNGSYLIMELLRGQDLGELIEESAPIPIKRTISILRQVAGALAAAHQKGIVHRDLTPDNIFLTERSGQADFVKVLDFGIAKLTAEDPAPKGRSTAAGSVVGTPAYMSPEQCLGRNVDYRTDIYAFGVMLYEMLTGLLPFEATTPGEYVVQHTTAIPRRVSDRMLDRTGLPLQLEELTMRCLEKNPDARPPSMDAIQKGLEELADAHDISLQLYLPMSDPPPARETTTGETVPVPVQVSGRRTPVALGILALSALLVGGWWATRTPEPARAVAAPTSDSAPREEHEAEVDPGVAASEAEAEAEGTATAAHAAADARYVTVSFESDPPGAEVWREGADVPVGTTPVEHAFLSVDEEATFHFRLRGYEDVQQEVSLRRDAVASVLLRAQRRSRAGMLSTMNSATDGMDGAMAGMDVAMAGMGRNATNGRRAVLEF